MSLSWLKRKTRLATLLQNPGDEQEEGLALDRLLHGQSVIGKTCAYQYIVSFRAVLDVFSAKTAEIESLRFSQRDLTIIGILEYGQFSVVCALSFQYSIVLSYALLDRRCQLQLGRPCVYKESNREAFGL